MAGSFEAGVLVMCKLFIEHAKEHGFLTYDSQHQTSLRIKGSMDIVESESVSGKESGLFDP